MKKHVLFLTPFKTENSHQELFQQILTEDPFDWTMVRRY